MLYATVASIIDILHTTYSCKSKVDILSTVRSNWNRNKFMTLIIPLNPGILGWEGKRDEDDFELKMHSGKAVVKQVN